MGWIKQELLGSGSFGQVYKATSEESGRIVVIKEVPAELISKREVALMTTLKHPHIIRYIEHTMVGDNLQLILEYAEGGTLAKFVESCQSPLPEEDVLFMASQMITGLDYLHRQRIVHRDLKPSNILLICTKVVKLADFGTSKCVDVSESSSRPVGTLSYMAPEIYNGGKWSTSSDIWSLGCIIYFIAERVKPFRAEAAGPLILSIVSQCADPIKEPFSEKLSNLVSCMMNRNESSRPSTADLLVHPLLTCTIHSLPARVSAALASATLTYSIQDFINIRLINP